MLSIIHDLPDYVLGVKATGEVTDEDLKSVLIPGLDVLSNQYGEIYYLLVLQTEVGNFTAGAWLQDLIAGIKHLTKWKKMAIVTDQAAVARFTDMFSYITPGEAKGFSHDQLQEAREWVSKKE